MTRPERLLLIAFFAVVLSVLGGSEQTATAIGAVTGIAAGVAASGRLHRLSGRMDALLGPDEDRPVGFAVRRPVVRAGTHLVVLAGLFVVTIFVPFVGDELYAGAAAAVTAFPLVLTASRLRR